MLLFEECTSIKYGTVLLLICHWQLNKVVIAVCLQLQLLQYYQIKKINPKELRFLKSKNYENPKIRLTCKKLITERNEYVSNSCI